VNETAPAGWYPDPEDPTQQRYWDGAGWTQHVAPTAPHGDAPQGPAFPVSAAQPVVAAPVLQTWKTSVGFSVLALFLGLPLLMILSSLLALPLMLLFAMLTGLSSPQSFSPILALVGNILMLAYALKVYPSFFSEKPRLRSNKAISFTNLMFGGLIFGLLWNGNLTKRTKGSSYMVSAVLSGLTCLSLTFSILAALFFGAISNSTTATSDSVSSQVPPTIEKSVQPLERTEGAPIYTDAETGASFVVPNTWTELPLSKARQFVDTKFRAPEGATAMYGSIDLWGALADGDKRGKTQADFDSMDDIAGDFTKILGYSGSDGTAQRIVLNGTDYFVLSVPVTTSGVELRSVQAVRLENGRWYQFQYWAPAKPAGASEDEGLQTFYSMLASMVYPKN